MRVISTGRGLAQPSFPSFEDTLPLPRSTGKGDRRLDPVDPGRQNAFTLVELLVVIGIIALLISILIPTLGKAREAANSAKCLSNARQLVLASKMFAADHKGRIPTDSDDSWAVAADPYQQYWVWRTSSSGRSVKDWASMLMPYLGFKSSDLNTFMGFANGSGLPSPEPKVFQCPSDPYQGLGVTSGYMLFNNVVNPPNDSVGYFPISYGINADIATITDQANPPVGRFGKSDSVSVTGGPNNGNPLSCRIDAVILPSQVLLYADCGVRPHTGQNPLDYCDALYYTTNYMASNFTGTNAIDGYTLKGVMSTSYLSGRVPLKRHGDKINIAFCDGHGETVQLKDFGRIHVSPYR